ncbi:MAG: hypothetical protein KDA41_07500, partial [Planctomycetales bacterium]|nr:hypothetical protein [Planctomycetales bacterium]
QVFTFGYAVSTFADDYNYWKRRSTTTFADGSQRIVYTNFIGGVLLTDFAAGSDHWIEHHQFDANAHETRMAHPSAVLSYDDTAADLNVSLRASSGLIQNVVYYSTTTATEDTAGGVAGRPQRRSLQQGSGGTPITQSEVSYFARTASGATVYPIAAETRYRNDDGSGAITTDYAYTWHDGTVQILQRTTTLPAVPASQNGDGTSAVITEIFDADGRLVWQRGPRGFIDYFAYDPVTGAMTRRIQDVDMTLMSGAPLLPSWTTPAGGGLHLVTDLSHDELGRTTRTLGPVHTVDLAGTATDVRSASWTLYDDLNREVRSAQGWASGASFDTFTLVNPVSIQRQTADGLISDDIAAVRASTSGPPTPSDSLPQSTWVRWTRSLQNAAGQTTATRIYHAIPTSGEGSVGTNYNETTFGYDGLDRQNRHTSPGGTITRTVFDARGRQHEI